MSRNVEKVGVMEDDDDGVRSRLSWSTEGTDSNRPYFVTSKIKNLLVFLGVYPV